MRSPSRIRDHRRARRVKSRVDHERIGLDVLQKPIDRETGRGRRAGHDADALGLQTRIFKAVNRFETGSLLRNQGITCPVIGICALNDLVSLRHPHDHVATMCIQRIAHEAGGAWIIFIGERLAELLRKERGDLVLEPLASLIRERQIPGVGAHPQYVRIDKFDRTLFSGLRRYGGVEKHRNNESKCNDHGPEWHEFYG